MEIHGFSTSSASSASISSTVGRLPGERDVVAKQAELQAVGDDRPEMVVGAVQKFLDEPVGRRARRDGDAAGADVEGDPCADQVQHDVRAPSVRDGERLAVLLDGPSGDEAPEAEFDEERKEPLFAGQGGGGLGGRRGVQRGAERRARGAEPRPRTLDRVLNSLGGPEVEARGVDVRQRRVQPRNPRGNSAGMRAP